MVRLDENGHPVKTRKKAKHPNKNAIEIYTSIRYVNDRVNKIRNLLIFFIIVFILLCILVAIKI